MADRPADRPLGDRFDLVARIRLEKGALDLEVDWAPEALITAVVGPSGAGKSTLLRALAGLEPRVGGEIVFRGRIWQDEDLRLEPWERDVGWVPQQHLLFPHLDVAGNLTFGSRGSKRPGEVERVARLLEIATLLDRPVGRLSGGEAQRVALGRALLHDPDLLLLDEPFSALDRSLRERVADRVFEWTLARDVPVVLVTHDESDVARHAGEVWEMTGGRLAPARRPTRGAAADRSNPDGSPTVR